MTGVDTGNAWIEKHQNLQIKRYHHIKQCSLNCKSIGLTFSWAGSGNLDKYTNTAQFIHKQELIIQTSYNHIISVLLELQQTARVKKVLLPSFWSLASSLQPRMNKYVHVFVASSVSAGLALLNNVQGRGRLEEEAECYFFPPSSILWRLRTHDDSSTT